MAVSVVSRFDSVIDPFVINPFEDPLAQVGLEVLADPSVPELAPPVRRPAPRGRRFEHGARPLSPTPSRPRSSRPASRPTTSLRCAPPRVAPRAIARPIRRGLRLTRRGQLVLVLVAVAAVYLIFGLGQADAGAAHVPASPHSVVVQQGDSLWSIAARVAPQRDPRDVVGKLESRNHLQGSSVQVGQILQLP